MNTEELRKVEEAAGDQDWKAGSKSVSSPETDDFHPLDVRLYGGNGQDLARKARHIAAFNPETAIALLDRIAALEAENAELRKIVSDSLVALGTSSGCTPEASLEFMKGVPGEIAGTVAELRRDADRYRELNTPEVANFIEAVEREAFHQRDRWGAEGDAGKTDADWFWLIGYLAGKAVNKPEKQLHHIITTAAACLNWHGARTGNYTAMRPGTDAALKENND